MTFLPIVARELRVAARKPSTYWVRSGAGLLVVGLGIWLFVVMGSKSQRDLAQGFFYLLAGSAVCYAALGGMRTTADCLSEEKREGTLGLLFLTDLRGWDVVAGKLTANSVHAFYSVAAILPMLAIPLLMGGVTPGEFARMALLVLNALYFSLCAGILASAVSRMAQRAMVGAMVLVMFFNVCLPAMGSFLAISGRTRTVAPGFLVASAGFSFYSALELYYVRSKPDYWISMGVIHGLAWAFLILASLILPHTWQERPVGRVRQSWLEKCKQWTYGDASDRAQFRQRLLNLNAFYWLAARERIKPALVWGFLALVGCAWAWGLAKARRAWLEPGMYAMTALAVNFVLRCWLAAEASRQIAEDRKHGTLELLLSTPLSVEDILRGQRMALVRQFLWPVVAVLGIEVGFMLATLNEELGSEATLAFFMYLAGMIMLVMDLITLYWVSMWLALVSRNQSRAVSGALGRVLILPWAFIAFLMLLLAISGERLGGDPGGTFFLVTWFFIGMAVDAVFSIVARGKLQDQFRAVAQERYAGSRTVWRKLLRR